jgi:hypothetical protein
MGNDEAAKWAELELSGYFGEPQPPLPLYRQRFAGTVRLHGLPPRVVPQNSSVP